jgi:hypothetical protein
MLPPHIDIDKEEDDEETPVSPAETTNNENQLVEVRVGRGMEGETNHGGRVQAHCRRMYAPGTLQRPARHSLSPTPEGKDCHGYTRGNPWAFKRAQEEPKRISNEGDMVQILF